MITKGHDVGELLVLEDGDEVPIVSPTGVKRERCPGTVEPCVRQLAAVINYAYGRKDTLFPAAFAAKKPEEVSRTPVYRADVKTLAAMFRYCIPPEAKPGDGPDSIKNRIRQREQLHRFLQISVATWGAAGRGARRVGRSGARPKAFKRPRAEPEPEEEGADEEALADCADPRRNGATARPGDRVLCVCRFRCRTRSRRCRRRCSCRATAKAA